jgi:hypothetical protein
MVPGLYIMGMIVIRLCYQSLLQESIMPYKMQAEEAEGIQSEC